MRFRRRVKLFPGVKINFSKSGISTTIGVRGASITIGKQGTYLNTGIPGTGIYDRRKIGENKRNVQEYIPNEVVQYDEVGAIKSEEAEATTSEGLHELKETLMECYQERIDLKKEITKVRFKLFFATIFLIFSCLIIIGFFINSIKQLRKDQNEYLMDLKAQLQNCFVNIDMVLDPKFEDKYQELLDKYKSLITSHRIWDLTSSVSVDRVTTRSAASTAVKRRQIKMGYGNIDIIKSKHDALHFENAIGGDLYIYPAFIALVDSYKKFGLIDLRELEFNFHGQQFIEEEGIPKDALVVGNTWLKVNKNGTPDKRFKDNRQIPICQYGEISLKSKTGLNEAYHISSFDKSSQFAEKLLEYQNMIKN
jgi:hypothetical protein